MKKTISLLLVFSFIFLLSACGNKDDIINEAISTEESTVETYQKVLTIKETIFVSTIDSIYLACEKYMSEYSYIKIEGLIMPQTDTSGTSYTWVARYGPGCCGSGTKPGFIIIYDGEIPDEDSWVEVVGTIQLASSGDPIYNYLLNLIGPLEGVDSYPYLKVERLIEKTTQGNKTVYN